MRRITHTLGAIALAAGFLTPAAALAQTAAPAFAEDGDSICQVTGGELTWGVKERFRSYISGTIANGEWTVSDGASYETPSFTFGDATGEIDAATGEGSVAFAGSVTFTGHDGVLNLTIENPTVDFIGDGTARLLLDAQSNNAEGELVVDGEQVPFGKIADVSEADPTSGSVSIAGAETILTAEGAEAFSGFYATGEALDPVTLELAFGPCAAPADAAAPEETPTEPEPDTDLIAAPVEIPWIPIIIAAVAAIAAITATTMLIAGRKKGGAASSDPNSDQDPTSAGTADDSVAPGEHDS